MLRRPDGAPKPERIYTCQDWHPLQQGLVSANAAAAMYPLYVPLAFLPEEAGQVFF